MTIYAIRFATIVTLFMTLGAAHTAVAAENGVDPRIWVRPGYELTVAEGTIERPRFLEVSPDGTLFVSLPNAGEIKACKDRDGDGVYESVTTFLDGYPTAHGLCWQGDELWFSQTGAILKANDRDQDGVADRIEKVIGENQLPSEGGGHWWRSILVHNGRIYTSVGDPSNIYQDDPAGTERMKLWSFAIDGGDKQLVCTGIRNTEKYDIRPGTDEIWGVDHDSDWFGEAIEGRDHPLGQPITDMNPCAELNHYVPGGFYGHPFITGKNLPRYEFMNRDGIVKLAADNIPPEWCMDAHCAGNGMIFYDAGQFPDTHGDAFVAQRGSWNRSKKSGYRVVRILFEYGHPYGEKKYVDFLHEGEEVLGRPADVTVDLDGSLLISDDTMNHVYRLRYTGAQ